MKKEELMLVGSIAGGVTLLFSIPLFSKENRQSLSIASKSVISNFQDIKNSITHVTHTYSETVPIVVQDINQSIQIFTSSIEKNTESIAKHINSLNNSHNYQKIE